MDWDLFNELEMHEVKEVGILLLLPLLWLKYPYVIILIYHIRFTKIIKDCVSLMSYVQTKNYNFMSSWNLLHPLLHDCGVRQFLGAY